MYIATLFFIIACLPRTIILRFTCACATTSLRSIESFVRRRIAHWTTKETGGYAEIREAIYRRGLRGRVISTGLPDHGSSALAYLEGVESLRSVHAPLAGAVRGVFPSAVCDLRRRCSDIRRRTRSSTLLLKTTLRRW